MNNGTLKLSYYQVMVLMHELNNIKKNNKYFDDPIARNFELYALNRTKEVVLKYPQIVIDHKHKFKLYEISQGMLKYLSALTGINPLDKRTIKDYIPIIKQVEAQTMSKFAGSSKRTK